MCDLAFFFLFTLATFRPENSTKENDDDDGCGEE